MSDLFDKTLLGWESRRKLLNKAIKEGYAYNTNVLVWVLGKDGRVFGSCMMYMFLQENKISDLHKDHGGLLWWPQEGLL